MEILITLLIASIGGFIATKLKFPAGPLIGALIAVSIYNIISKTAYMPLEIRVFTQIISGIFIGATINREELYHLRKALKPAFIVIALLFIACITMGVFMHLSTQYDIATTLFATAPGGLLNTMLMSYEMNANTAVVSVLQITRLVTVISLFPILLNLIIAKYILKNKEIVEENEPIKIEKSNLKQNDVIEKNRKLKNFGYTLLVGSIFGIIGYLTKIPAGTLMFAMFGASVLNIFWSKAYVPLFTKKSAQIFGGALIGTNVTIEAVIEIKNLIIPAILMIIGYFLINILLAYVLHKKCHMDWVTALFSCTPGGASTISIMADDFGAKVSIVSTLQILRSICVIAFYPFIIQLIYILINI